MNMKHKTLLSYFLLIFGLVFLALLVYAFNSFFKDGLTISNIWKTVGGVVALAVFIFSLYKYNHSIEEKKANLYDDLTNKYQTFNAVKSFINENLDENNQLKPLDMRNEAHRPSQAEIEDFMRFFKDLMWRINRGDISWADAKKKFSKYALLLHQNEFFRQNINDYYSFEWQDFRDYCDHILHMN